MLRISFVSVTQTKVTLCCQQTCSKWPTTPNQSMFSLRVRQVSESLLSARNLPMIGPIQRYVHPSLLMIIIVKNEYYPVDTKMETAFKTYFQDSYKVVFNLLSKHLWNVFNLHSLGAISCIIVMCMSVLVYVTIY